jgi:UTP--glucose-1-phosphate uridylyltransferase
MLPDDIMVDEAQLLRSMLDTHDRYGRSVLALLEVPGDEISSYGCVEALPFHDGLVEVRRIIEKPPADEAPSNLAVFGRYVFTADIFDALDRIEPGRGGELQLTDAIALLLDDQSVYGQKFESGRHDIGQKLGFLRANIELALDRDDLGDAVADMLRDIVQSRQLS